MLKNTLISSQESYQRRLLLAIFLHSLSIIGFQVILMRILSIMQWDHFANMIIGVAMLGFGVSGTLLALTKQRLVKYTETLVPFLMTLSSLLMLLAYRFSQTDMARFDTFLVFSSGDQLLRLVVFLLLFFLPFLAASLAIGLIYVKYVAGIGKLYFANLFGSGIGGFLAVLILFFFLPQNALLVVTLFPVIAALILFPLKGRPLVVATFILLAFAALWHLVSPVPPVLSQYKSLAKTLQLPDARVKMKKSGVSALVEIVESDYLRYAPGLSLHFTGQVPVKPMAFVNGNAAGFIPHYKSREEEDILNFSTYQLPYALGSYQNVCVVQSGTGGLVAHALRNNAEKVMAVESELSLINALNAWHSTNFPSVYDFHEVSLYQIEARSFFNTTPHSFDLIYLPTIGSFGGASGLQAIREEFALTLQALQAYWQKLSPGGAMALTVYTDFPPRATLKAVAALTIMLKNNGIDSAKEHITAIRSWTSITFMVTKEPLGELQLAHVRDFCSQMGFDPFILPDITDEERVFFNYIDEKDLFEITDAIIEAPQSPVLDDYLFYIHPATDNKPYFSRFIKISKIGALLQEFGKREIPFLELGYVIVWLTFIIVILVSLLLILLPVIWLRRSTGKLPVVVYFGAIGLGFMFAEIILIQRFVLYLGQPVYAVSTVLSIMLLASGMGSYFSARLKEGFAGNYKVYLTIFLILLVYALFLTSFLRFTAGYHLFIRVVITCLVVALPAFFMGMPFPLGLKTLSVKHKDKIAWAWGINGFFSVIATPLALIIAIEAGSVLVISLAAIAYLMALAALFFLARKK